MCSILYGSGDIHVLSSLSQKPGSNSDGSAEAPFFLILPDQLVLVLIEYIPFQSFSIQFSLISHQNPIQVRKIPWRSPWYPHVQRWFNPMNGGMLLVICHWMAPPRTISGLVKLGISGAHPNWTFWNQHWINNVRPFGENGGAGLIYHLSSLTCCI